MELRPILSALLRNRTGAALVGLQIALTLAVVANACFIVSERLAKMRRPTGLDAASIFFVQSSGFGAGYQHLATVRADVALLNALPGVIAAGAISHVPMSGGGTANGYQLEPGQRRKVYFGNWFDIDEHGLAAFGVRLVAGRSFRPEEIVRNDETSVAFPREVILSQGMARKMFGDAPALGRRIYGGNGESAEVIGVTAPMMGSWVNGKDPGPTDTLFHPTIEQGPIARYVVRTRPGDRARVMAEAERRLSDSNRARVVNWVRPLDYYEKQAYRNDHRMIVFLVTLAGLMIAVTALGIVGLATFHVNARRKQTGTRRAIGARRIDIVRYFLLENALLGTAGVVVGVALAYAFSGWLSSAFALPPLAPRFVLGAALGLLALGQLAVLWPARRAAGIPPAVATRTV